MERNTVFSAGLENCQLSLPHPAVIVMSLSLPHLAVIVMSLDNFLFTIFVKALKPNWQLLLIGITLPDVQ